MLVTEQQLIVVPQWTQQKLKSIYRIFQKITFCLVSIASNLTTGVKLNSLALANPISHGQLQ